jgi:hypothetical protein
MNVSEDYCLTLQFSSRIAAASLSVYVESGKEYHAPELGLRVS